ncbi:MAG: alpha/beta fold hydrolase [Myxococcaceae bacterium]|nr:alpha/beta fold hydrolase [Myxococcaceae bacterium]
MSVLLLHGFTRDGSMWRPLLDGTAPNLPGHAGAAAPVGGFEGVVDALAGLLPAPFGVAGYSMGARLALCLAIRHPSRVSWLVLDGATLGLATEAERAERRARDATWATLLRERGIEAFSAAWAAQPLFGGAPEAPERKRHDPLALAAALEVLGKGSMPWLGDGAAKVRCPVLLVNGSRDERGLAEAARVAKAIPHARTCLVPGHHAAHLEAPDAWRARVHPFLEGQLLEATA